MSSKNYNGPPLGLGSFFGDSSSEDENETPGQSDANGEVDDDQYLVRESAIAEYLLVPGQEPIKIREFAFHSHNANFVWKGNEEFAAWMLDNRQQFDNKKILELACGTGILSIFMKKQGWDVTSSDYNDGLIDRNMLYNIELNGLEKDSIPHLPYTWGDPFPNDAPIYDVVIANDILIYESTYSKLADSLKQILSRNPNSPRFYLGHKRRVKTKPSFFEVLETHGLKWKKIANYIYEVKLEEADSNK